MEGVVSAEDVRARCAYSELLSLGHGVAYSGLGVPELKQKAREKLPFDALGKADRYLLVDLFDRVRGRYFNRYLLGVTTFQTVYWTKDQLGAVRVIPFFAEEIGHPHALVLFSQWIAGTPIKPLNQWHARYAAHDTRPHSIRGDALTVGHHLGFPFLLDGYHRAVRFWSTATPTATLTMYVPAVCCAPSTS
jgi:hypothetical protein